MKKILLFLILICFCELIFSQPGIDKNWSTTTNSSYSDDFNSPSLNLTKWKVWNQDWDLGNPNPNLHVWKEFCFTNDKARLTTLGSKSVLELSALKDSRCTTLFGNGSSLKKISSGAIEYANIANYPKYGYFEASCMFNVVGDSYMPAFWLWDSNSSNNPNDCWYNEIDIEIWSHLKPSMPFNYTHTVHYKDPSLQNNCAFAAPSTEIFTPANTLNDGNFHKYGIEWTPERVIWYYDDSPIRMKTFNIPSHPMRILFDLGFYNPAVSYNPSCDPDHLNNTFPGFQYVDYINVYDLMKDCSSGIDKIYSSPINPVSEPFMVRKKIIFQSVGVNSIIPYGTKAIFRGSEFETQGEFTISLGSEVTLLPTTCY